MPQYTEEQLARFRGYAENGDWGFHPMSMVGAEEPRTKTKHEIHAEKCAKAEEIAPDYLKQLLGGGQFALLRERIIQAL